MTEIGRNQFSAGYPICRTVALLLLILAVAATVRADENGYAVLIEQSPIHAGTVNPGLGVHKADIGSTITLTAMPKPGYRFLYWLGDVNSPASMSTQVRMDAPKIVVAVYERDEFELPLPEMDEGNLAGAPRGGAMRNGTSLRGSSSMMAFYPEYDYLPFFFRSSEQPDIQNDPLPVSDGGIVVPGGNNTNPEPAPEPATLCLLAAGFVLLRGRRRGRVSR